MSIIKTVMVSVGIILAMAVGMQKSVFMDIVVLGIAVALIFGAMGLDKGRDL